MVKRVRKGPDGKYHVKGRKYDYIVGSRAQVWHGTAYKTPGGLRRDGLTMNKWHRIVSKKKQRTARREKRLERHGYFAQKGKFGHVRRSTQGRRARSTRRSRTQRRRR